MQRASARVRVFVHINKLRSIFLVKCASAHGTVLWCIVCLPCTHLANRLLCHCEFNDCDEVQRAQTKTHTEKQLRRVPCFERFAVSTLNYSALHLHKRLFVCILWMQQQQQQSGSIPVPRMKHFSLKNGKKTNFWFQFRNFQHCIELQRFLRICHEDASLSKYFCNKRAENNCVLHTPSTGS